MPDPESITPLLAERLDISDDRAETLLQSMLQELKSRAATDGVHLSDLGTFEEEDGTLTFIPSPSLRRRVNHQFEGLSPEDLSAPPSARPEAEAPPSLRESSRERESSPDEAEASASEDEPAPAGKSAREPEDTPDEPEGPPTEPEESMERSIPTLDPLEDEPEDEAADVPPSDDTDEAEEADTQSAEEEEEEEEEEPVSPMGSFSLIGSILLVVILVGVGWLVFSETNLWSSSQPSSYETSERQTTQPTGPESSESEPSDDVSPDDQPDRYAGVRPGDEPDSAADAETGPWAVVVASLSSRTEAEAMAAEYKANFSTVQVLPTTVNNAPRYRVAVGRYDSQAAARRALDANASMMPSDAWTHELP